MAFDSVWRVELWHKSINVNVIGKILTVIRNRYRANIKSCVSLTTNRPIFKRDVGMR